MNAILQDEQAKKNRIHGFVMLTLSSIMLSIMVLVVRHTLITFENIRPIDIVFVRFTAGTIMLLIILRLAKEPVKTGSRKWMTVRGVFGAFSISGYYVSVSYLGVAQASIILHMYTIWGTIFAAFLLHERVRPSIVIATLVAFFGMYLVIMNSSSGSIFEAGKAFGVAAAFFACVTGGVSVVAMRRLRATDNSGVIYLGQCVAGMIMMAIPFFTSGLNFPPQAWAWMFLAAVLALVGQLLVTNGYRYIKVGEAAPFAMLAPVISAPLAILLFGEFMSAYQLIGGIVVVAACVVAVKLANQKKSKIK